MPLDYQPHGTPGHTCSATCRELIASDHLSMQGLDLAAHDGSTWADVIAHDDSTSGFRCEDLPNSNKISWRQSLYIVIVRYAWYLCVCCSCCCILVFRSAWADYVVWGLLYITHFLFDFGYYVAPFAYDFGVCCLCVSYLPLHLRLRFVACCCARFVFDLMYAVAPFALSVLCYVCRLIFVFLFFGLLCKLLPFSDCFPRRSPMHAMWSLRPDKWGMGNWFQAWGNVGR